MKQTLITAVILYFLIINLTGFCAFGIDKRRARQKKWRIRERTLFLFALFGGSPGCLLGMSFFRHKTKHVSFRFGIPAILIAQIALIIYMLTRLL